MTKILMLIGQLLKVILRKKENSINLSPQEKGSTSISKPLTESTKENIKTSVPKYKFSNRSKSRLNTCHVDLQKLFNEVIKEKDCAILEGKRSAKRQYELYLNGKSQLDGVMKRSNHQVTKESPLSYAVDVMPYPIDWEDLKGHQEFADFVFKKAKQLDIKIKWGGNWKSFKDNPHWELDRKHYA